MFYLSRFKPYSKEPPRGNKMYSAIQSEIHRPRSSYDKSSDKDLYRTDNPRDLRHRLNNLKR